jgi:hypothetical protein
MKELKVMTQSELNHAIARQTGEPVTEIARRGFTILAALPQDDDGDPHTVISERYRVHKMEDLTIREASALIDDLKLGAGVRS